MSGFASRFVKDLGQAFPQPTPQERRNNCGSTEEEEEEEGFVNFINQHGFPWGKLAVWSPFWKMFTLPTPLHLFRQPLLAFSEPA